MRHTPVERWWRIGDLAQQTGLTVRTLHHYEQLGLLAPRRTEGNQRLYEPHDLARLYRIRALRDLGLSLAEIGALLDSEGGALATVLSAHLKQAEEELARLTALRDRLRTVSAHPELPVEDLLGAIEAMSHVARHAERRRAAGAAPTDQEARWRARGEALRAAMDRGDPPNAAPVRALAREIDRALRAFAEDDPATLSALAQLRRVDAPAGLAGWDAPLTRYLDLALQSLHEEEPC